MALQYNPSTGELVPIPDGGPRGLKGEQGDEGPKGKTGAQGLKGRSGDPGVRGPIGPEGPKGDPGPKGDKGAKGDTNQGTVWYSGEGIPPDTLGRNGDFYFRTDTNYIYEKVASKWAEIAYIGGSIGPKGDDGLTGADGQPGEAGAPGVGIAPGGTTNQVLAKASNADFDTKWVPGGGGGGGSVDSVNSGTAIDVDNADPSNPIVNLNATTADVPDSTNKRYVTDAELAVLGNTSGANTGDQDLSGLVPKTTTVNGHALSSNVTVSKSDVGLGSVVNADTTTTANISDSTNKRFVTDAELTVIANTSGVNTGDQTSVSGNAGTATKLATARNIDGQAFDGSAAITVIAPGTHAATSKSTPVDADELPLVDSAASNVLKKLTWANLKAAIKSYYDSVSSVLTNKDLTDASNTFPTFNQNTSGTASNLSGTPTLPNGVSATTQAPGDNSVKLATTAYADNASISQGGKEAVVVATTANLTGIYLNGSSGVGATFTYTATGTDVIDGVTLALGNRVLLKNQTSTFQNGLYTVTAAGALGVAGILTRATDFDQSTDIKTGQSVYVLNGTAGAGTTWDVNSADAPTMGTSAITFAQSAGPGSFVQGNGIAITGNSIAIDTAVVVDTASTQASIGGAKTWTGNNTFSSGVLALNNGSTNLINMGSAGVGAPTLTSRSGGTKFLAFVALSGSAVDYAVGVESFYMWFSTPTSIATGGWKWYAGTTLVGVLTGQGVLSVNLEIQSNQAITVASNAGTADVTHGTQTFTNSSAAAMTITLTTTGAVDGQIKKVRIYDFSAVAEAITWVNTENSTVTAPALSNGSTTLPLTAVFMYNSATSKWRCVGWVQNMSTFVGESQSATTTLTVPAHNIGDDIYYFAYATSGVIPGLIAGYTTPPNGSGTGGAQGWRVAHLIATGTSDGSGTVSNAAAIVCVVYSNTNGPGNVASLNSAASTNVVTPSMTLNNTSGSSQVISFQGSKQATSLGIISGLTQRGTTQLGTSAAVTVADTNGGVSSFAGGTATAGASAVYVYASVEILAKILPPASSSGLLPFL